MSTAPGQQFSDWNRFANSNGIGSAIKTGLTAYGMQKSGLTDWLNSLNATPMANGPLGVAPGVVPGGAQTAGAVGNNPSTYVKPVVPETPGIPPVANVAAPAEPASNTDVKSLWDHTSSFRPLSSAQPYDVGNGLGNMLKEKIRTSLFS